MAAKIVHAWARTKDRPPTGYRTALCGLLVPRRQARQSGVTCTMCQTVRANTTLSTMGLAGTKSQADRRGGGR